MEQLHAFPKIVESLYVDAMLLADEARSHFDPARNGASSLPCDVSVALSCESLKVTMRLMHCISWLLNQKAHLAGELSREQLYSAGCALGISEPSDPATVALFPIEDQDIIRASERLYARISDIDARSHRPATRKPEVHRLREAIGAAF